uniref:Uncharacterized protein n=1 Tax=Arundo donax TaxID=35708 RepID=A0A0A8Y043_ARUDO
MKAALICSRTCLILLCLGRLVDQGIM